VSSRRLYYSPGACSLAPHIVAEETGLPFEAVKVDFAAGEQRSAAYLALNPKGRVPVLVDGDQVFTECPAILRHLARRAPEAQLWPADPVEDTRCLEWLCWGSSGLHVAYAHVRRAERYARSEGAKAEVIEQGKAACKTLWAQVEERLARGGAWAAGNRFSVADAYLFVFWLWGRGNVLGYDMMRDFPAWTERMLRLAERPGFRRALAREGIALPQAGI